MLTALLALITISAAADSAVRPGGNALAIQTCASPNGSVSDQCFFIQALDRYFPIPTRYVASWDGINRCAVFTSPRPAFGDEILSEEYKKKLTTQSGSIRLCDRFTLDREAGEITAVSGPGLSRNEGAITIKIWRPDRKRPGFTATYFSSAKEGLMVYDLDPGFAERMWRDSRE